MCSGHTIPPTHRKKFVIKISSRASSRAGSRSASPRIGTQVEEAETQQQQVVCCCRAHVGLRVYKMITTHQPQEDPVAAADAMADTVVCGWCASYPPPLCVRTLFTYCYHTIYRHPQPRHPSKLVGAGARRFLRWRWALLHLVRSWPYTMRTAAVAPPPRPNSEACWQ